VDDWNVDEDEGADVWKAEERAAFTAEAVEVTGGVAVLGKTARGMDAVAMERRERTRSSGYVVQTDVMPAKAPLASRFGVSSSFDPYLVNAFFNCS